MTTTLISPPRKMHPDHAPENVDDPSLRKVYDRTRMSLIERLSDWEDQRTWNEFYESPAVRGQA